MTSWMDFTFFPPADTDTGGGVWRKIAVCSGDQVEVHWTSLTGGRARTPVAPFVCFSALTISSKKLSLKGHPFAWRSDEKACLEEQQSARFIGAVPSLNWTFYVVKSIQLI